MTIDKFVEHVSPNTTGRGYGYGAGHGGVDRFGVCWGYGVGTRTGCGEITEWGDGAGPDAGYRDGYGYGSGIGSGSGSRYGSGGFVG